MPPLDIYGATILGVQDAHKLAVYGEARELAVALYQLTRAFPSDERFGLTQQLRRAAVSVRSNIAEGCAGKGSRALVPFLHYAIGSTKEIEFQAELAVTLRYCDQAEADVVLERIQRAPDAHSASGSGSTAAARGDVDTPHPPLPATSAEIALQSASA